MVTKEILTQYSDLLKEKEEVRNKIAYLEDRIPKLEEKIKKIEDGELVKDKVRGGLGGIQSFTVEGVPTDEYQKKRTELLSKKLMLNQRKSILEILEFEITEKISDVEEFISSIDDSRMRRIINLKFIENLTWLQVANRIGGGNTESSIKMSFHRFMENN